MNECSACGTELLAHDTRCPVCGKPTAYYHYQRRCLHCGTPAAEKTKTCMMCGQPVDSLPLRRSIFSGSWIGIGLGIAIIVGLVWWVNNFQASPDEAAQAAGAAFTPTHTPTITRTPTETGTPLPTATFTATPSPTPSTHIVERGETLFYLSQLYGVPLEELATLNNLNDTRIVTVGQEILIPFIPESGAGPERLPSQIVYVIEEGDTLLGIALRYGTTVDLLSLMNPDANLDLIYPGQELVVPLATPTPTPTPTSTLTPTPTPGPRHPSPGLLSPVDGRVVTASTLFFNWTATSLLAEDEFYVLQLTWPDGSYSEHWTKATSWHLDTDQRPASGAIFWQVTIRRQTGLKANGSPTGPILTEAKEQRTVTWQ